MLFGRGHGWKDTVLVNGRETVRVLVRFHSYTGRYIRHCHNLEHENDGMMQNADVLSVRGAAKTG